ncbi:MAG: sigma 54-interacting transcriptional regulator [Thermodesulfobacteriota bacterium]|nr:sigma 54-interacting transcriptional regulator [Thermodesulfobacteriota bacterium]
MNHEKSNSKPYLFDLKADSDLPYTLEHSRLSLTNDTIIINSSAAMQQIYADAKRIARSFHTVLITGPTGVGKEVIAKLIHRLGPQPDAPFIEINCGAIAKDLIESHLFGHERGAFTGAIERHCGDFETTGNGTLFLDEIGEMPLLQQVKLLRVIETKRFRPVGSSREKFFNGRIIAATNVDLEKKVRQRTFREDLFYRLNVFHIYVPSLKDRREDIAEMARYFASCQHRPLTLTSDAMTLLTHADWPGNVRQLRHTIDKIAILSDDTSISADTLQRFLNIDSSDIYTTLDSLADSLLNTNIDQKLAAIENVLIIKALKATNNNKSATARLLGVHRKQIERKMKTMERDRREIKALLIQADSELSRSEFHSALKHYEKIARLLEQHPYSQKMDKMLLYVLVKQGICQRAIHGWQDKTVIDIYEKVKALRKRVDCVNGLSSVTFGIWVTHLMNLDLEQALVIAEEYLKEGRCQDSPYIMPQACLAIVNTRFWMGDFRKADIELKNFLGYYHYDDQLLAESGYDPFVLYLMLLALNSFQLGQLARSRNTLKHLLSYSEKISHTFSRAISLQASAWLEYGFGNLDSSHKHAEELIELSITNSYPFYEAIGLVFKGSWQAAQGDIESGARSIRKGYLEKICKDGGCLFNSMYSICMGNAYLQNRMPEKAIEYMEAGISLSRERNELCYLSDQIRLRGYAHLSMGNVSAAESDFRTAMIVAEHQHAKTMAVKAAKSLINLLVKQKKDIEATELRRSITSGQWQKSEWPLIHDITFREVTSSVNTMKDNT